MRTAIRLPCLLLVILLLSMAGCSLGDRAPSVSLNDYPIPPGSVKSFAVSDDAKRMLVSDGTALCLELTVPQLRRIHRYVFPEPVRKVFNIRNRFVAITNEKIYHLKNGAATDFYEIPSARDALMCLKPGLHITELIGRVEPICASGENILWCLPSREDVFSDYRKDDGHFLSSAEGKELSCAFSTSPFFHRQTHHLVPGGEAFLLKHVDSRDFEIRSALFADGDFHYVHRSFFSYNRFKGLCMIKDKMVVLQFSNCYFAYDFRSKSLNRYAGNIRNV